MTTVETILQHLEALPSSAQQEVLDFVEFLRERRGRQEEIDWSDFSLRSAMRGMEHEEDLYTLDDVKELFQ